MTDFDTQRALAKNRIRRRGFSTLPNRFRRGALSGCLYATVEGRDGRLGRAGVGIFSALVL